MVASSASSISRALQHVCGLFGYDASPARPCLQVFTAGGGGGVRGGGGGGEEGRGGDWLKGRDGAERGGMGWQGAGSVVILY